MSKQNLFTTTVFSFANLSTIAVILTRTGVCVCVGVYVCKCRWVCVCVCVWLCVYRSRCVCVCIYIYIYKYTPYALPNVLRMRFIRASLDHYLSFNLRFTLLF